MSKFNPINFIMPTAVVNDRIFNIICTDKIRLITRSEMRRTFGTLREKSATDFSLDFENDGSSDPYFLYPQNDRLYEFNTGLIGESENETNNIAIRFSMALPEEVNKQNINQTIGKIKTVQIGRKNIHLLELGQYPKTIADENTNDLLNKLFNNGQPTEELKCTGRIYSKLDKNEGTNVVYLPEFEYNGQKYVRSVNENGINWYKVEPIDFIIKNYDQFIKDKAISLELESFNSIFQAKFNLQGMFHYKWSSSSLRAFLNSETTAHLDGLNQNKSSKIYDYTNRGFLDEALNINRKPIKKFVIPAVDDMIEANAFDGCLGIEDLEIPQTVLEAQPHAFDNCSFNYIYVLNNESCFHLCKYIPDDKTATFAPIEVLAKAYSNFSKEDLVGTKDYKNIINLASILIKNKVTLPFSFVKKLAQGNALEEFVKSEFKYFKSEPSLDLKNSPNEKLLSTNQINNYYSLLTAIGCFSNEKIEDSGKEIPIAQLAISLMAQIKKNNYDDFIFSNSEINHMNVKPNRELLNFLSQYRTVINPSTNKKEKQFYNIEMLLEIEKEYPSTIPNVFENFDIIKKRRNTFDENGNPKTISYPDAIARFFLHNKYNISFKNSQEEELAKLFLQHNIEQNVFINAQKAYELASKKNIPPHILGKPLKEPTIQDEVEKIKNDTDLMLKNGKDLIQELYHKHFTYEMLAKNDPINSIIGVYASCCCTLTSEHYGKDIAEATITAKDVQNLVLRDEKNEIIAKATIYVNEKLGYAVINEFDINEKFKERETNKNNGGGVYLDPTDRQVKERDDIFNAFMRGIQDFIKEYDAIHPNNPLQKVNVGMGHNRLKGQCARYRHETKNLIVPAEYKFNDASFVQVTLYDRNNPVIPVKDNNRLFEYIKNFEFTDIQI